MSDFQDLSNWWEEESQKDLNRAILELGRRLIKAQINCQKRLKALERQHQEQEERLFQRQQKLFSRVERWQRRVQTMEERIEILIELEVEDQKIVFSKQVDRSMEIHQKMFLETVGAMLQTFQEILREQNLPKGRGTRPKA